MRNKLIIVSCLLLANLACTEKDLTLTPEGKELDVTFYKNEAQLKQALYGAYDPLQHIVWGGSSFMWGSIASDDAVGGGADASDQKTYQMADRFSIEALEDKDKVLIGFWTSRFKMIYRSNLIIAHADATTPFGKIAVAHANFLKGLAYFELTRMFGGLPIIDKLPGAYDKFPRATQADTWKAIETYLNAAIDGLPERKGNVDPDGLATVGSAQALLGKALVYQKKYTEAAEVLEKVAANTQYGLEPNYASVFDPANKHSKESLFEINFTSTDGGPIWDQYVNGNATYTLVGPRTGEVTIANATFEWGWGMNQPTPKLAKAFDDMGDKIRKNNSILSSDSIMAVSPTTALAHELTGYWDLKHIRRKGFFASSTQVAQNTILLRMSDVYLLLAEAYANSSNEAKALTYLNMVRNRAGLANATGGADLFTKIKKERQLELCLEGDRYFDLVRWGDAATELKAEEYDAGGSTYANGKPGVATNGLFPIPQDEMNTIGTDPTFPQNPGY